MDVRNVPLSSRMGCRRGTRVCALAGIVLAGSVVLARADGQNALVGQRPAFDPRAVRLLQQMVDAYSHLSSLQQETEFTTSITPIVPTLPNPAAPPDPSAPTPDPASTDNAAPNTAQGKPKPKADKPVGIQTRLLFAAPNRMRFESRQISPLTGKPALSEWICDGKTFWSYREEKNWYTKEKAPGSIRDFIKLRNFNSGSLELLMLMGLNPFADIQRGMESVQYEGPALVNDVPTEVVVMRATAPAQNIEAKLYIGKADFLLRRFVTETTPIQDVPGTVARVGDPLDELLNNAAPLPSRQPANADDSEENPDALPQQVSPVKTRLAFENTITPNPKFDSQTFAYTPSATALLYSSPEQGYAASRANYKAYLNSLIKNARGSKPKKSPRIVR